MCGRYTLSDPGDLLDELGVTAAPSLSPRYNIAPTQEVLAVRQEGDDRLAVGLRWGLIPYWAKDAAIGNRMINARSETVAEKPSFKHALKRRRCLIPADGFYEWVKTSAKGPKQPYHIHFEGHRPFVFAGLWEVWKKGPEPIESCTVLTTDANEEIRPVHHRMPVILEGDKRDAWLDPSIEDSDLLSTLLGPLPDGSLQLTPVSTRVNSPRNDVPECLEPVAV